MSPRFTILFAATAFALSACGGTKLVKHPTALPTPVEASFASATDAALGARLEWIIVRDSPGTWAKNADWDEYFIRVRNTSGAPIRITGVSVVDSLGQANPTLGKRKALVKASRKNAKRYKQSNLRVVAGVSGTTITAAGVGVGLGMGGVAASGGGMLAGAAGAAAFLTVAPAFAVVGIFRGVRNSQVNNRIEDRQSKLPASIAAGEEQALDLFFPLSPSPTRIQITYADAQGTSHQLDIDTSKTLAGLHLGPSGGSQASGARSSQTQHVTHTGVAMSPRLTIMFAATALRPVGLRRNQTGQASDALPTSDEASFDSATDAAHGRAAGMDHRARQPWLLGEECRLGRVLHPGTECLGRADPITGVSVVDPRRGQPDAG